MQFLSPVQSLVAGQIFACPMLVTCVLISGLPAAEEVDPIRFQHISIEAGLSDPRVNAIHQDAEGFIWIATDDGLSRFDGREFRVYRPPVAEGERAKSFHVNAIHEAADGSFWVGGENTGFSRFDPVVGEFVELHRFDAARTDWLASRHVLTLQDAPDGKLWVGTDWGGLHRYDPPTGTMEHFPLREPTPGRTRQGVVYALHADATDPAILWIGTAWMGLVRLDSTTGEMRKFFEDPNGTHEVEPPTEVSSILEGSPGVFWITSPLGLYRFDANDGEFVAHYEYRGLNSVMKDRDGRYWVSSATNGLARFFPENGEFHSYRHSRSDPTSLSDNRVKTLFQDRGGMIWAGMWTSGICVFDPGGDWIREHQLEFEASSESEPLVVFAMLPDEQNPDVVWLGTTSGLVRWDRSTGRLDRQQHDPEDATSLSHNSVRGLARRAKGGFWIATNKGLNRFDPVRETVIRFQPMGAETEGLAKGRIFSLHEDRAGMLWIGRERGARKVDLESGEIETFFHGPADPGSIGARSVTHIFEDSVGNLWFGHQGNGVSMLARGADQFVRFESEAYVPGVQSEVDIASIHEDSDGGIVWVGTNRGLMRIETESHTLRWVDLGGRAAKVNGIDQDREGHLWLRTGDEVLRVLERDSLEPVVQVASGSVRLSTGAVRSGECRLENGDLLFAAPTGVWEVRPAQFRPLDPPRVAITDFELVDQSAQPFEGGPDAGPIRLSHAQNKVMRFKFAALDFAAPERNRFAYRLDGLHDDWQYDAEGNRATFTTLKPGEYVFRVRAANSQGTWSEEAAAVAFKVLPPWWTTWWFRSLAVVSLIGMCLAAIGIRTRSAHKRAAHLEAEAVERDALNRELRRSEQRFQSFIANSSEQIWCVEFEKPIPLDLPPRDQADWVLEHGHFTEANEAFAEAYGATVKEALTWKFERVMPRELPTTIPLLEEVARSRYRMVGLETNEVAKDGSDRIILNNLVGTIRDGAVVRVWGTARDITDQRRAEQGIHEKNAALESEVAKRREAQGQLHDLASRLIHTQEHERRHIARELHDDLTQRLAAMAMDAQIAERDIDRSPERAHQELQEIQSELTEMATSTQELSRQLHPKILEELGLARAVRAECRRVQKRLGIDIDTDIVGADDESLSTEESLCLYRILQEGLGNVGKHAKATRVEVALRRSNGCIELSIKDDGVGFDPSSQRESSSLGMVSMSERARLCGATFEIESKSGAGTKIAVSLPNHQSEGNDGEQRRQ